MKKKEVNMRYPNREITFTAVGIAMLIGLAIAAPMFPELWRYMKIRSM